MASNAMKASPDNPTSNQLPAGVSLDQLVSAARESGYPLQTVVATTLLDHNFTVVEEWGYPDRETAEHRSLDVYAELELSTRSAALMPKVRLLIECKRSELPYTFFVPAAPSVPLQFPTIIGLGTAKMQLHKANSSTSVPFAKVLCCKDFKFVNPGPTIAAAFSRAERDHHWCQWLRRIVRAVRHLNSGRGNVLHRHWYEPTAADVRRLRG